MELNIVQSSDGRRQRSERSQTAIIAAALALMEEGTLVPTAQQVADRAGVGIRSFFRHFADMDSLFLAVDASLLDSYEALFRVDDRSGSLGQRTVRAIDLYGNAFDKLSQIVLCTKALLWRFPKLKDFLEFWDANLEGPLYRVRVAHRALIAPTDFRIVDGELRIH